MKPILICKVKSLLLICRAPTLFRRSAGNPGGKNTARGRDGLCQNREVLLVFFSSTPANWV